jgi:hypothetical protein
MSTVHEGKETFWISDPGFSFTVDWGNGRVCVPSGRTINDRDLAKIQEKTGIDFTRNHITKKRKEARPEPSEPSLDEALSTPLRSSPKGVEEMSFPCVHGDWCDLIEGAYLTPPEMVRVIDYIRDAKNLSQADLGTLMGTHQTNISNALNSPHKRVETLKKILSLLTGIEFTETRHRLGGG